MNEKEMEMLLNKARQSIEVNHELKEKLRKGFVDNKTAAKPNRKRYLAAACIGILLLTGVFSLWLAPLQKVQAESLVVQNYRTYLELESNQDLSVAEYQGTLYIPDIQQGIYRMRAGAKEKIYTGNVSFVTISPDGKELAFVEDDSIYQLDLETLKIRLLIKNDASFAYSNPSWFENKSLLLTKQALVQEGAGESPIKGSEVIRLNLDTMNQEKLAEGSWGAYIRQRNLLLYQQGDNILLMDLKNGKETVLDQGTQPAVSPDGSAIVYSKLRVSYENIQENAKIERVLQDLWVADGQDYGRKTKITSNIVLKDIDREDWLANLKPGSELQILSYSGRYCYLFPTWSSDSKAIYARRRDYEKNKGVVVKIDLGKEPLAADAVVERFLQAVQYGDHDYQSSLVAVAMKGIEELQSMQLKGYKITETGMENGNAFVDTDIHIQAGNGQTIRFRFYLEKQGEQYYIVDMKSK